MDGADDITEAGLRRLVETFYARVRTDPELGPIFEGAIADWPRHLDLLAHFWSSVTLTSGRYKGNPMAAHLRHGPRLSPVLFRRWLALWAEATAETMPPAVAASLQDRAARIAASLQMALSKFEPARNHGLVPA